jgi:hypothetical protein
MTLPDGFTVVPGPRRRPDAEVTLSGYVVEIEGPCLVQVDEMVHVISLR